MPNQELEAEKPLPVDLTSDSRTHYHLFGVPQDKRLLRLEMQRGASAEQSG